MFKLEKEMPEFLRQNQVVIGKKLYSRKYANKCEFDYYSPAYLTTTENINGYYDMMDFEGKSVLTVVGASDHIFNAIVRGAKKVDGFDISIYAIMFYYLKEAALKSLEYMEFVEFLYSIKTGFNKKTYQKIMPYMNSVALPFWNYIFNQKNPIEIILSPYFAWNTLLTPNLNSTIANLAKVSSFITKKNFYLLKEKMKTCEIRIFLEDVNALDNIDGTYDYIILSNIIDYVSDKEKFYQAIEQYISKLNILGEIKVGYIYANPSKYASRYIIDPVESFSRAITGSEGPYNYMLTKKRTN